MNISNNMQTNNLGPIFNQLSKTQVTPFLSKIVLGTSLVSLVGLLTYRWCDTEQKADTSRTFTDARAKVQSAYGYVFGGFVITALAGKAAHISGFSLQLLKHPFLIGIPLTIGTGVSIYTVVDSDKKDGASQKIKWVAFNILMGASLSVIGFYSKQLITQAAAISLAIGGTATLISYLAPDETFLKWQGPILNGLTGLSIAGFISGFFPKQAAEYGVNKAISYLGLLAVSGILMGSTQRLFKEAKSLSTKKFDPIISSLGVYLDGVNIFVRVINIIAESQKEEEKKKKSKKT